LSPLVAGALVFYTSGAVLVVEILAGRLLAPYVGVSLETYTGVIGTVLAGIAAGTWTGGYVADRVDPRRALGPLLVAGGALCLASVPIVRAVGSLGGGVDGGSAEVVWMSLAAFFAPAAVLSAVTPTVVKLQLRDLDQTGTVVGRLSALATAGAILGTFLAGFVLVEAMPTTRSITLIGLSLLMAGMGVWLWLARTRGRAVVAVGLFALLASGLAEATGSPCDTETVYHCARVVTDDTRPSGRFLVLDNLNHSYVDLADPTYLQFRYIRLFADVIATATPPGPLDAVHIGGGGFTLPRYLRAVRPGTRSVVLEIDRGVVDVSRRRLGLSTDPDLQVHVGDARRLLVRRPPGGADLAVGDAFGGLAVPWHLTTVEFARDVHSRLRPGGLYILNIIDEPPLRFARAEAATLAEVFDHVLVVTPPFNVGGNVVVAASDRPFDVAAIDARIRARSTGEDVLSGEEFAGDAPTLRDDHAPVDQWLAKDRRD
jgi:spermidine synthase